MCRACRTAINILDRTRFFFVGQQFPADVFLLLKNTHTHTHVRRIFLLFGGHYHLFFPHEMRDLFRKSSCLMAAASRGMERINSIFPHSLRSPNHTRTPGGQNVQLQDIDRRILWIARSWARPRNTPIAESIFEISAARHYNTMSAPPPSPFQLLFFTPTLLLLRAISGSC